MQFLPELNISDYKDIGVVGISLIVLTYAKYMADKSYEQVKEANNDVKEANNKLREFIEHAYKDNTKTLADLLDSFNDHIKLQDQAVELLKKQHEETLKLVQDQRESLFRERDIMLRERSERDMQVPKDYRKHY